MLVVIGTFRGIREVEVKAPSGDFIKRLAVLDMGRDGMVRQNVVLAGRELEHWTAEPGDNVAFECSVSAFAKRDGSAAWDLKAWREAPDLAVGAHIGTLDTAGV